MDKKIKPLFLIQNFDVEYPNDFKRLRYEVDFPIYEKQVILFTGRSGVGKSTLFLLLKGILSKIYSCKIHGNISYYDKDNYINIIDNYPQILEKKIGYLGQNPYTQIVNPKVIDELVFGMENHKFTKDEINKNAIFYSNLFGLTEKLFDKTKTLSGGLCQRLNLASILSYKPDILLLDEPVSFLDEDAARSFYEILKSLKGEKTIIIIEHIFDQILDIVDNILVFENEKEFSDEKLRNRFNMKNYSIAKVFYENKKNYFEIKEKIKNYKEKDKEKYEEKGKEKEKKETKELILEEIINKEVKNKISKIWENNLNKKKWNNNILLKAKDILFKYDKNLPYIFENLEFEFYKGEIIGIIGENGCGKSTFLKLISKMINPEKGELELYLNDKKVKKFHHFISLLFQNSESSFFFPLVKDEVLFQIRKEKVVDKFLLELLQTDFFDISKYYNRSGFTLSEGEKRRLGFLINLLMNRPIRLYDEPTYAQDLKRTLDMSNIIKYYKVLNTLQIVVSHDTDFLRITCDKIYRIENKKLTRID